MHTIGVLVCVWFAWCALLECVRRFNREECERNEARMQHWREQLAGAGAAFDRHEQEDWFA